MKTLTLLPDDDSYSYEHDVNDFISERFQGAASAYGKGTQGPMRFTCRWTLNEEEYIRFVEFFRFKEKWRTPFQIDLISADAYPVPHVAKFIYNTYGLVQQSGNSFVVGCDVLARVGEISQDPCVKLTEKGYIKITEAGSVAKVLEVCPTPSTFVHKLTEVEIMGLIDKESEVTDKLKVMEKEI